MSCLYETFTSLWRRTLSTIPLYWRQTLVINVPLSILLAMLIHLSRSVSPQEAGSRQIGALDYAGAQLDSPEHDDNLPEREGIPEEGL